MCMKPAGTSLINKCALLVKNMEEFVPIRLTDQVAHIQVIDDLDPAHMCDTCARGKKGQLKGYVKKEAK